MERLDDWDEYFMQFAELAIKRSTCFRRQVGAVVVRDKHILATGYNGAPRGLEHCSKVGCIREEFKIPSGERTEICRASHAEQNVIVQAARVGVSVNGATLYCTHQPCSTCAKMIINAGIFQVFYLHAYPDELALSFIKESGLFLTQLRKS